MREPCCAPVPCSKLLLLCLLPIVLGGTSGLMRGAEPPARIQAVTDRLTYNAGGRVRLRIVSPLVEEQRTRASYVFSIRFAGEQKPIIDRLTLDGRGVSATDYTPLWTIPNDTRTGRYEIDLRIDDPKTNRAEFVPLCSFVVHRQLMKIAVHVQQEDYTSGDSVGCGVQLENLSSQPLAGLQLEFSERYWPWIAQQREKVGRKIATLRRDITLESHGKLSESFAECGQAQGADRPVIKEYGAVVWDRERKTVYAIAFTSPVFINPPGVTIPRPYPAYYMYPNIGAVNTTSYRQFHSEPYGGAIQFDLTHTQFPVGSGTAAQFTLTNPTDAAWRQVTVRARLLGPDGKELAARVVADHFDLDPHAPAQREEVRFSLPPSTAGLYRVAVEINAATGELLATNMIEWGVNPLPRSVLLFCGHEDDEGTQSGFIRTLIENQIPLHLVYVTSGDAGSCDQYFARSCGPEEALDFGAVRMQEARAAMGHLGVPAENIIFLGMPDGGSGQIWYDHPHAADPLHAVLLASDRAPYAGLFRPNLPFARDAVVDAAAALIRQFQPEVIFTVHPPAEGHIDHIVNNYFVVKALQQLVRENAISPNLELRVDRIFSPKEHPATPYQYEDHEFYVSGAAMALAQEADWYYQSQGGNRSEGNLRTWDQLPRTEGYRKVLDWSRHEGWNER